MAHVFSDIIVAINVLKIFLSIKLSLIKKKYSKKKHLLTNVLQQQILILIVSDTNTHTKMVLYNVVYEITSKQ